jgi:hypothetical protein
MDVKPLLLVDPNGAEQIETLRLTITSMTATFMSELSKIKEAIPVEKRLYTTEEAALYLGVSASYLRKDACEGPRKGRTPGPTPIRFFAEDGSVTMVRYAKEDLDAWIDEHRKPRRCV